MENINDIVEFTGWENGIYGTFLMNSLTLPNGKCIEKILIAHEYDWTHSTAMSCHQEYKLYEDVQRDLGKGLIFKCKEYSVLLNRSLFLYDFELSSKRTEVKIAVPATGEEVCFEIYGLDDCGKVYLLLGREL